MVNPVLSRTALVATGLAPFLALIVASLVHASRPHNTFRAFLEILAGAQGVIALYFFLLLLEIPPDKKLLQYWTAACFWIIFALAFLAAKLASETHIQRRLATLEHPCRVNQDQPCRLTVTDAARLSWQKLIFFAASLAIALWFPSWLNATLRPPAINSPTAIPQPDRYVSLPSTSWKFLVWAKATGTTSYTLPLQDLPQIPAYDSIIVEVSSPRSPIHFGICQAATGTVVDRSQQPLVIQNTSGLYKFLLPNFDRRLGWYVTLQAYTGPRGPVVPELETRVGYLHFR